MSDVVTLEQIRKLILEIRDQNKYFLYPKNENDFLLERIVVLDDEESTEQG
mgnify:CR=1 FL=1|jgi:hypothetical protein